MAVAVTSIGMGFALVLAVRAAWPSLALTLERIEASGSATAE
jgi:hypothetical protein